MAKTICAHILLPLCLLVLLANLSPAHSWGYRRQGHYHRSRGNYGNYGTYGSYGRRGYGHVSSAPHLPDAGSPHVAANQGKPKLDITGQGGTGLETLPVQSGHLPETGGSVGVGGVAPIFLGASSEGSIPETPGVSAFDISNIDLRRT